MSKWEIEKGEDTYGFWIYENGKTICEVEEIEVAEQICKEHNGYEAMRGVLSNIHAVIALQGQLVIKKDSILYDALTKALKETQ